MWEIVPLFHPRNDAWDDHFQVHEAGITPTGTATARLLKMNDGDQLEIRTALILRGEF
jgi:hypothetical protein